MRKIGKVSGWEMSPGGKRRLLGRRQKHLIQLQGRWERPDLASALAGERGSGGSGLRWPATALSPRDASTVLAALGPAVSPRLVLDPGSWQRGAGVGGYNVFIWFPGAQNMLFINPGGSQTLPKRRVCSLPPNTSLSPTSPLPDATAGPNCLFSAPNQALGS